MALSILLLSWELSGLSYCAARDQEGREKPHKHRRDFEMLEAAKLIVVAVFFLTHVRLPRSYV
jgi:hypothetical protein